MKICDIIEGLQLIAKYCDEGVEKNYVVEGEHEIVYAQPDKHKDDWLPADAARMKELGWFWHDDGECWAMHT